MSTPQFILDLRQKIGNDPLWLMGITAVVVNSEGRLLLARRADTHEWAFIYGIIEPGEQPAVTVVREVAEETGLLACVDTLVAVTSSDRMLTYANGDQAQYMDHMFLCHVLDKSQEGYPADGENLDVGWFDADDLPSPLAQSTLERLDLYKRFVELSDQGSERALFINVDEV